MNFASLSVKTMMLLMAFFCTAATAISQTTQSDRLAAVKEWMQQLSQKMPHMPDQLRNALSGSTQNFLRSVETSNTKLELEPREGVDLRAL
jgi:predicted GNAT superfamily acetyltransferase